MSSQNSMPYTQLPTDTPTRARFFLVHKWRVSEETHLIILRLLHEMSARRSTSKIGTGKDYLLHYLRSPAKSTFKRLCKQTPLWLIVMSEMPQEPWRSRWPQERDIEQSALTHTCHTHCASWQLGTTANWRYDVPRDWLRDACQMARVWWGTHCKGIRSKEGLHFRIERSARNPLERNQVQRALVKSSRSCRQTSNNQPWFTALEIPWGFLAWDVLHQLRVGLCHVRKCQCEEHCVRRKGMVCKLPTDVRMKNIWQKAEWETGTNSCTSFPQASCFEKTCHVCQKYGGACIRGTRRTKGIKKWDEKLDSCAAERGAKKLVSSASTKK